MFIRYIRSIYTDFFCTKTPKTFFLSISTQGPTHDPNRIPKSESGYLLFLPTAKLLSRLQKQDIRDILTKQAGRYFRDDIDIKNIAMEQLRAVVRKKRVRPDGMKYNFVP